MAFETIGLRDHYCACGNKFVLYHPVKESDGHGPRGVKRKNGGDDLTAAAAEMGAFKGVTKKGRMMCSVCA